MVMRACFHIYKDVLFLCSSPSNQMFTSVEDEPPPQWSNSNFLLRRQLTREQLDLKGALERQVAVNQKLSQEKEQLMFKLRHRESRPGIHLPAMMQEITPR